jgi:hypothetical protein
MTSLAKVAVTAPHIAASSASAHADDPDQAKGAEALAGGGYLRLADTDADYARLGIDRTSIAPREDGQRESIDSGHYEWWYFDAHLDDGATIVVVFYTKPASDPNSKLAPVVTINLTLPDGRIVNKAFRAKPDAFSASRKGCDVRIGANRFVGDLHRYRITARIEDVSVDIDLVGEVPPWRPKSGHTYFAKAKGVPEKLFAWLPSVPQGRVTIDYTVDGVALKGTGIGYHDNNWGDAPMPSLMHDWYWARAKVGPYSVVTSYITACERFGYETETVFLLAKDGAIVADDGGKVAFAADRVSTDHDTGKPVADITRYTYTDGELRYVVTYERQRTILQRVFADKLPFAKRVLAKIAGVDSAYLRFTGTASVEKFDAGKLVERFSDPAIWELMYFGHARPPAT